MTKELARAMAERITEPSGGGVRWTWDALIRARTGVGFGDLGAGGGAALLQRLGHFKSSVTLVYGDSSNLMRPEHAELQRKALPDARRVVLSGGHNLHYDDPDRLAEIIAGAASA
jgi:pimeloyl-ACP methyl ester carboxylesterase